MERLSSNYKSASLLEILMEYCIMYDTENLLDRPEGSIIEEGIARLVKGEELGSMTDRLDLAREDINGRMQVLTAYVDRFMIYEYIFDRIRYKYTVSEAEFKEKLEGRDKEQLVKDLYEFVFGTKDNVMINERIRELLECLPIRIARSKYLDLVGKNCDLFSGSDRNSLDGFVYMLRTAATIYEPDGMDDMFPELKQAYDEFAALDIKTINRDYYTILSDKLDAVTEHINQLSDMYMTLQKFINMLYVYALNEDSPDYSDNDVNAKCLHAISELYAASKDDSADLITDYLLEGLEGSMEKLYDERNMLEITEGDANGKLVMSGKLMSSSLFAPLKEEEVQDVTAEYLASVKESLTGDLKKVIEENDRPVARAIFAMTIGKLHTFFNTSEDVYEYIYNSIMSCGDEAELLAVYDLTDEMMVYYYD